MELLYITRMQLALKLKEPNPLNFFEIRRSKLCVPHYEYITIPYTYNIEESLNKWVKHNLKGRYYVVKTLNTSKNMIFPSKSVKFIYIFRFFLMSGMWRYVPFIFLKRNDSTLYGV